jgi:cysteine desulfurase / selenocysteine lyase
MRAYEPERILSHETLRTEFPGLAEYAYFDAASLAPLPRRARDAIGAFNDLRLRLHEMQDADFSTPLRALRERAARLIGAEADEISIVSSTSMGVSIAALGLHVPPGTVALVSDREFPANVYPWMDREAYRLEIVPATPRGFPDEARLVERLEAGDVSILTVSSVQFSNGYRMDLEALSEACRRAGALFFVDAIQSLGHLPIDVRRTPIDVLACGSHKWLCGPFGVGILYVRRDVRDRLEPVLRGWGGTVASRDLSSLLDYDWQPFADGRRYEVGTPPFQDVVGVAESLGLILEIGVGAIEDHVLRLMEPLREWISGTDAVESLSSDEASRVSGIVSFRTPDNASMHRALRRAGVVCSLREEGIRVSGHFYNSERDVQRLLAELQRAAETGWR